MSNDDKSIKDLIKESNGSFLMDAELISLIDKANDGCLISQSKLAIAFCRGDGAKKNEKLALHFEKLMSENTNDNRIKLAALWNPAIREYERGNYQVMIEKFNIAIDFMQENIPMEKWDFSLFEIMEKYTQLREDE